MDQRHDPLETKLAFPSDIHCERSNNRLLVDADGLARSDGLEILFREERLAGEFDHCGKIIADAEISGA